MRNEATEKAAKQAREMFRTTARLLVATQKVAECRLAAQHLTRALVVFGEVGLFLTAESSYDEGFTDGEAEGHDRAMAKVTGKVCEGWTDKEAL